MKDMGFYIETPLWALLSPYLGSVSFWSNNNVDRSSHPWALQKLQARTLLNSPPNKAGSGAVGEGNASIASPRWSYGKPKMIYGPSTLLIEGRA